MRIKKIKYENFRNFKEPGCIDFPTDGTIAIIYGPNGVGKTTLHQLFQWIFYGEVQFNKTASNKMYNLQYEQELDYGSHFSVIGSIDFDQPNSNGNIESYSIRRQWYYRKELTESKKINEKVDLIKLVGDDWTKVSDNPEDIIEQFLPSGLSQYFFFDGESMIADLNQKGKDSAKSLRKALYSIFDLDIYEQAMAHIGTTGNSSTVLGKLNMDRSANSTDADVIKARGQVNQCRKIIEDCNETIEHATSEIDRYNDRIKELSEKIGSTPPRAVLENQRALNKNNIKTLEDDIQKEIKLFGKDVVAQYPYLFLSRIVEQAQYRIGLKIEDDKLIPGLSKDLVLSLMKEDKCICGREIGDKEIDEFQEWLKKFPPLSYKYVYDQFKSAISRWSTTYNPDVLVDHLTAIFDYQKQIDDLYHAIDDIDNELKNGTDVDQDISERAKAEESVKFWSKKQTDANQEKGLQKQYWKQRQKKYDELVKAKDYNEEIDVQMDIMDAVYSYFDKKLQDSTELYSSELCENIQDLLNRMLTSVRTVEMTSKFELKVKDSFGDEAKSEGQFAVVSFAYIGGILKLLSEVPELKGKEFPLVLDGPFSKLDAIQRQNVIDTIPSYAPQIILFSKDDLTSCFQDIPNHVWTIYSNDERNVSYIKEGYNQEVFVSNED